MKKSLLLLLILLVVTACSSKQTGKDTPAEQGDATKLSVYTTVYPLLYFTERIGGDFVDVNSIYPPGADEHTFDPTQKEMMALADSDLFFYIGLGLEGFVEKAEKTMKSQHVKMVPTAETIPHEELQDGHDHHDDESEDEHEHGMIDPHVWISPSLSVELAASIKNALSKEMPAQKEEFEKNFQALQNDLVALDTDFKDMSSKTSTKTFFVSHAAFGYLAHAYGFEQVAIAGLNSQSEPSQKELATLVKEAKEKNVRYILFEQNNSSKLTDVIRKEIGAESLLLHNLAVLTTEDIKNNEDYFTLMERNKATLKKALGGK